MRIGQSLPLNMLLTDGNRALRHNFATKAGLNSDAIRAGEMDGQATGLSEFDRWAALGRGAGDLA